MPFKRIQSKLLLTLLGSLLAIQLVQAEPSISTAAATPAFDHQHTLWEQVLQDIVVSDTNSSQVDYQKLMKDPSKFESYLKKLEAPSREQFDRFDGKQQLAFLINTYNAQQIKQVIDNYPIKSIKNVGFMFSSPWSKNFFSLFGKDASLNKVEHGLIRTLFNEPRIHFAVNCASIGCPPLRAHAFTAEKLEQQLEAAATQFLNNAALNHYDAQTNTLTLSPIFNWYEGDFTPEGSDEELANFAFRYIKPVEQQDVDFEKIKIQYSEYNWNLNEVSASK